MDILNYLDSSDDEFFELVFAQQLLSHAHTTAAATDLGTKSVGSRLGRRPNKNRFAEKGAARLLKDYFAEVPVYTSEQFRRHFRMSRRLFLHIAKALERNKYFVQKRDATGKWGLTNLQKCTAAIQQLICGSPSDASDEYVRMGESTARKCLREFCQAIDSIYGEKYLRSPTHEDLQRLLQIGEERGFPGMLGSLDCTHWQWKNCPTSWAGKYKGKEKRPTIILEVIASQDLWIWHASVAGSNNDVNILERSTLFADIYNGKTPHVEFQINGHTYNQGYYLTDGIYPPLSNLVQTISSPVGEKRKHFAAMQEFARKDVERTFGVLTDRFGIIKNPAKLWNNVDFESVMRTCIILHNMIIEDERDSPTPFDCNADGNTSDDPTLPLLECAVNIDAFLARFEKIHDIHLHYKLQNDLIEHLWRLKCDK